MGLDKMRSAALATACLLGLAVSPASAQLATPNAAGVALGHIHLVVRDADAQMQAWEQVLGARALPGSILKPLELPGIFILVTKARTASTGGTMGSVVHHIGFLVKDYAAVKAKAQAAGLPVQELTPDRQAFITFPDDVTVEVLQDETLATPVAFHHVHLSVTDSDAARDWYDAELGAQASTRRNLPAAKIPGGEVDFLPAKTPQAPTKGRALDHIGFEVTNLEAFVEKLRADGVQIDIGYLDATAKVGLKVAFITDPNGVYIELTEGLNAL